MTLDDSLRQALVGNPGKIDGKLNNILSIIDQTIPFVPATKPFENESNKLKSKYIYINAAATRSQNGECSINGLVRNGLPFPGKFNDVGNIPLEFSRKCGGPQVPVPQFIIYPEDAVKLAWDDHLRRGTGVGLNNLGNTCFLNSILQVLANTAPLVNYLHADHHSLSSCPSQTGYCAICVLRVHVKKVLAAAQSHSDSISPQNIVSRLRCVMKNHAFGRQEDAHEFLRYFVDAMQNASLHIYRDKKLDLYTKETSPIGRIFGGYHKNDITCLHCQSVSTTFDPFLDISLEIKQFNNIEQSLQHFTRVETLSNDNAYKCPKCNKKVAAHKNYSVHEAPNVLTIQLKRFDHFGKIDKFVAFPEKLNLRPYTSQKQGRPIYYKLYGVVVHSGRSLNSGHYFCFVRNPLDQWHLMDDSRVCTVGLKNVLQSSAYLLFYVRVPLQMATVKPQPKLAVEAQQLQNYTAGTLPPTVEVLGQKGDIFHGYQTTLSRRNDSDLCPMQTTFVPVVNSVGPVQHFIPRSVSGSANNYRLVKTTTTTSSSSVSSVSSSHNGLLKIKINYSTSSNNDSQKVASAIPNRPTFIVEVSRKEKIHQDDRNAAPEEKITFSDGHCLRNPTVVDTPSVSTSHSDVSLNNHFPVTTYNASLQQKVVDGVSKENGSDPTIHSTAFREKNERSQSVTDQLGLMSRSDTSTYHAKASENDKALEHEKSRRRKKSKDRDSRKRRHSEQRHELSKSKHVDKEVQRPKRRRSSSPSSSGRSACDDKCSKASSSDKHKLSKRKRRREKRRHHSHHRHHCRRSSRSKSPPRQTHIHDFYSKDVAPRHRSQSKSSKSSENRTATSQHDFHHDKHRDTSRKRRLADENKERLDYDSSEIRKIKSENESEKSSLSSFSRPSNVEATVRSDEHEAHSNHLESEKHKEKYSLKTKRERRKEAKKRKKLHKLKRQEQKASRAESDVKHSVVSNGVLPVEISAIKKPALLSPFEFLKSLHKPKVKSWDDGNESSKDHIYASSTTIDSIKEHSDAYNAELDAGKVKKVKRRKFDDRDRHTDGTNPFQRALDVKYEMKNGRTE